MARTPRDAAPQVEVASAADLRHWLAAHHDRPDGVWLVTWRKGDPRHLAWADIVDELLCWGWVDSLPRARDAARTMLWIAPRRAGSNWSRINRDKVARLEAAGRMADLGRAAVARPRRRHLDRPRRGRGVAVPDDLAAALGPLRETWDTWPRSVRRGALEILLDARRPGTRARKIADIAAAREGRRPFQWRRR